MLKVYCQDADETVHVEIKFSEIVIKNSSGVKHGLQSLDKVCV